MCYCCKDQHANLHHCCQNPSVVADDCSDLKPGWSYCVEGPAAPAPAPAPTTTRPPTGPSVTASPETTTTGPSGTTSPETTTTSQGNGIATPTPIMPGMVGNCDEFFLFTSGSSCANVLTKYGITLEQFVKWNPNVGAQCTTVWADYYVCVSVTGHSPSDETTSSSTAINPPATPAPTPIQTPVDSQCYRYHQVASSSTTCQAIVDRYGIRLADFFSWNPSIANPACNNLKPGYHVCIGATPSPIQTPVSPWCYKYHKVASSSTTCPAIAEYNSIRLQDFYAWNPSVANPACDNLIPGHHVCVGIKPAPLIEPVVPHCSKYHQVASSSTTCQSIAAYNNIRLDDFYVWNPSIARPECNNLIEKAWVCVGVPGAVQATPTPTTTAAPAPTTTKPDNGVATPTPHQPNMTGNCKSFHKAASSATTCQSICDYRGISLADFYRWNPDVGVNTCAYLYEGYYYCYEVL